MSRTTDQSRPTRASRAAARFRRAAQGDAGMTTAEYAVGTVAACGFGGVLYEVIKSPQVMQLIVDVIHKALSLFL